MGKHGQQLCCTQSLVPCGHLGGLHFEINVVTDGEGQNTHRKLTLGCIAWQAASVLAIKPALGCSGCELI